jgi:hypothetical protein
LNARVAVWSNVIRRSDRSLSKSFLFLQLISRPRTESVKSFQDVLDTYDPEIVTEKLMDLGYNGLVNENVGGTRICDLE